MVIVGFDLSGSVGDKGDNRPDDVRIVQDLLNAVPVRDGGQQTLLSVDGIAGPRTKHAIQTFQLKQFGWKLADSRVDPGGQTWGRLCDQISANGESRWSIRRVEQRRKPEKPFRDASSTDRFYEVFNASRSQCALYWFGTPDIALPRGYQPPYELDGRSEEAFAFQLARPTSVYAVASKVAQHTELSLSTDRAQITLQLNPLRTDCAPGGLSLSLSHRWIVTPATPLPLIRLAGYFRFIRSQCPDPDSRKVPGGS
jgi:peptidoglycan hydrolase-like protein with peptidoglycan-binding domain